MSRLSDTIGFFSPQVYRLFNETTVSTSATNYGSLTTDTITLAGASGQRSYSTDAPIGSDPGSWSLEKVTGLSDTRITHNNTNTIAQFTDRDYTFGFWVKYVTFPNNNSATANVLASVGTTSSTGSGFTLNIYGSTASAGTLRKLQLTTGNGTTTVSTIAADQFPDDGGWHYIAVRRVLSDIKVYLDGSLIITGTNPNIASAAAVGYGGIAAFPQANFTLRISHSHLFTSSAVDEAAIAAIWNAGSTLPGVTIAADPITASADQVDATIVVTGGNFTEITTSITVDATFPDAAVQAQANNNIVVTETLDALAEIGDNIQAGGSLSTSFDAVEFTASALMTDAIVSRSAMTASADIVDSTVYVDPNYFNLVKQSDPLVYCQFDSTTFVNDGSLTFTESTVVHSTVIKNVDSGNGMGLVGSGKSWKFNSGFSTSSEIYNFTELGNLDGDYTIEYWFKPTVVNAGAGVRFSNIQVGYIKDNATMYVNVGGTLPTWDILGDNIPDSSSSRYIKAQDDSIILNEWNHIVVRVESDTSTSGTVQLFINGNVAGSLSVSWNVANMLYDGFIIFDSDADEFFGPGTSNRGWYEESTQGASGSLVDQFAIYGTSLSNSTIIDHYGFIDNLSPDATVQSTPLTISATSGDHEFVVTSNAIPEIKEATASAAIVEPDIQGGKSKEVAADVVTATANAIDPSVSYDFVVEVDILAAYAESANAFALNTMYFDYVAANVLPYRYVTFDGSSSYADYGTDADYSVAPASGGTIVTPEFGINGKSAKIDGSTYTDGVILKESEWNDNWGTGQND